MLNPKSLAAIKKEAHSMTIRLTIREIEQLLGGEEISTNSQLRAVLHEKLFLLLQCKIEKWYERGFRRGHSVCRAACNKVPQTIKHTVRLRSKTCLPADGVRVSLVSKANKP